MSRYYCNDCGTLIENNLIGKGFRSSVSRDDYKNRAFCSVCNSDDVVPAEKCAECGEELNPNEIENGLCEKCRVRLQVLVKELFKKCNSVEAQEYVSDCVCEV